MLPVRKHPQARLKPSTVRKYNKVGFHNYFEKISNTEKSIHIIEFSGKKVDQQSRSKKFISYDQNKGYRKLLVSSGSTSRVNKIPMQEEYENALESDMDLYKKIIKLDELNQVANDDLMLSIKTDCSVRKDSA